MTVIEKARKYANYTIHHSEIAGERNRLKQAYLDGLAEGRKELEKGNEELKAQVAQLAYDNHILKTSFITQQELIEKMKICDNCKNLKKEFDLCVFSGGDKDYWCRGRKWEIYNKDY